MNNDLISRSELKAEVLKALDGAELTDYEPSVAICEIYDRCIDHAPPIETTIDNLISTLSVEDLKATTGFKIKTPSGEVFSFRREKTEAEVEQRARMTNQEASQILQEEANGIPSDLSDEHTERFKEAVRIATQALNTMPFMQDMSDTIDRLKAENQTVPVEIEYNNQKRHGYFDKKRLLIFPEYITAEFATKIGITWQEDKQ